MEVGKYPFVDLIIGLEKKVIQSPPLDDHKFTPEVYEFICEAVNTENMKYLYAHFGDDSLTEYLKLGKPCVTYTWFNTNGV